MISALKLDNASLINELDSEAFSLPQDVMLNLWSKPVVDPGFYEREVYGV